MIALLEQAAGGYFWQATDSTFSSTNPAIISDAALRSTLIRFHDGFLPFMLNRSQQLQQAQREYRNTLYDDYERYVDFRKQSTEIRAITLLDRIPTNGEFFKQLDDYSVIIFDLLNLIPLAI